ncbi:hypothetical protein BC629DRAFT_1246798, partial [Irpex lacteus]
PPPADYFKHRICVSPRLRGVDEVNSDGLQRMSGEERGPFLAADTVLRADGSPDYSSEIPLEFLRSLPASGLPPGELRVR